MVLTCKTERGNVLSGSTARLEEPFNKKIQAYFETDWGVEDAAAKRVRQLRQSIFGRPPIFHGSVRVSTPIQPVELDGWLRLDQVNFFQSSLQHEVAHLEDSLDRWGRWADHDFGSPDPEAEAFDLSFDRARQAGVHESELFFLHQLASTDPARARRLLYQAVQEVLTFSLRCVWRVLRSVQGLKTKCLRFLACRFVGHGLVSLQRRFYLMHSEHPIEVAATTGRATSIWGTFQPA
jgi:hypothetical protein